MIEMKKIRNLYDIKVLPADSLVKIYPDGNHNHIARVKGWNIHQKSDPNFNMVSPDYTLEDLKQLRKEIRKVIRNESNKRI